MEAVSNIFDHQPPVKPDSEPSKTMAAGTVLLNRYMLMELIGQGGTSEIYRARDMVAVLGHDDEQSHIAVKVISCNPDAEVSESHLMLHEALTTRHLAHPNIIKVYDYHREGHVSFVTMELIAGEPLSACLLRAPQNKLPYRHVMAILRPTALALEAAHTQGVIHSDIKPSNILMTDLGDIKVIDFATARASLESRGNKNKNKNKLNHNASFYGYTLAYASPETIADKPATPSDDVFSLACIAYEALSGNHPYDRRSSDNVDSSTFNLKKPREVGFWQWFVLKKALSLQGKKRFQSVHMFMQLFRHTRWMWLYLGAVIVILTACVIGAQFLNKHFSAQQIFLEENQKIFQQQQDTHALINSIREEAPLLRHKKLKVLDDMPELIRHSVLGALYDDIVAAMLNHVENELNYNGSDAPDFLMLIQRIEEIAAYYPDSVKLSEAKELIRLESRQLVNSLAVQAQQLWAQMDFSQSTADTLNNINLILRKLDKNLVVTPEASVIDAYRRNVEAAIARLDYVMVNELFLFASVLAPEDGKKFQDQWRLEDARARRAAQLLVAHMHQKDRFNTDYPTLAVEYYIKPFFDDINKSLFNAWSDKAMINVKEKLFQVADIFELPKDFPMYAQTHEKLTQDIERKIVFHKRKGNRSSIQALTKLLEGIHS